MGRLFWILGFSRCWCPQWCLGLWIGVWGHVLTPDAVFSMRSAADDGRGWPIGLLCSEIGPPKAFLRDMWQQLEHLRYEGWGNKKRMSTVLAAMEELPKRVGHWVDGLGRLDARNGRPGGLVPTHFL